MFNPQPRRRVSWQHYAEPDPVTGRPIVKVVWPRYVTASHRWWTAEDAQTAAMVLGLAVLLAVALWVRP